MKSKIIPLLCGAALAAAAAPAFAATSHVDPSLTFISGFSKVFDFYKDSPMAGDHGSNIPVGLSVRGGWITPSGVRFDLMIGPLALIYGDFDYHDVPLGASVAYAFNDGGKVNPYVRVGGVHHFVGGDFVVDNSANGFLGTFGMEFLNRPSWVKIVVEAGYDTSKIKLCEPVDVCVREEDVHPSGFLLSAGASFRFGRK